MSENHIPKNEVGQAIIKLLAAEQKRQLTLMEDLLQMQGLTFRTNTTEIAKRISCEKAKKLWLDYWMTWIDKYYPLKPEAKKT